MIGLGWRNWLRTYVGKSQQLRIQNLSGGRRRPLLLLAEAGHAASLYAPGEDGRQMRRDEKDGRRRKTKAAPEQALTLQKGEDLEDWGRQTAIGVMRYLMISSRKGWAWIQEFVIKLLWSQGKLGRNRVHYTISLLFNDNLNQIADFCFI